MVSDLAAGPEAAQHLERRQRDSHLGLVIRIGIVRRVLQVQNRRLLLQIILENSKISSN